MVERNLDLNGLIAELESAVQAALGLGCALVTRLSREPLPVLVDAAELEQVLVNLVIDARDAVGGGGPIELWTRRLTVLEDTSAEMVGGVGSGHYACLELRAAPGAGLGLARCIEIVRRHQGGIAVESQPGRGTLVRLLLPLEPSADAATTTSGVVPASATTGKVLVVEDDPQVRSIAVRALARAGFEVHEAANGALGLALIRAQALPFGVIVTDVVMPELNGPELARAARQLDPGVGLVFMSGYPQALFGGPPDEFAGAAFLAKPFARALLVSAVRARMIATA